MHKSVFIKGIVGLLGLASLASAQAGFKYWDPSKPELAPKLISQTGLYANIAANPKTLIPAAQVFEVNSPLWSDNTAKKRWFLLKTGKKIGFKEMNDYWNYPDSTVFIKDFAIDTIEGNAASRVLWETRFLILKKEPADPAQPNGKKVDQWYGFSYKWRKDQMDADLVADTGLKASIKTYPKGLGQPAVMKKWIFPPRDKCMECHRTESADTLHGRSVLGFFTAQINRKNAQGVNQITDFFNKGYFSGTVPANLDASPRWYGIDDTDPAATLEKKSRAYIAANCSGCHGDRGMDLGATFGVDLNYDYFKGVPHQDLLNKQTSWGYGLDTLPPVNVEPKLIVPGYPEKSVIIFRQKSRNTAPADDITGFDPDRNQMPPLATFEVNEKAMKVISDWVKSLPPTSIGRVSARQALLSPAIQGRNLMVPAGLLNGNPAVSMTGIDGRTLKLTPAGPGVYAIPQSLTKGVYIVRIGAQSFTRYLF